MYNYVISSFPLAQHVNFDQSTNALKILRLLLEIQLFLLEQTLPNGCFLTSPYFSPLSPYRSTRKGRASLKSKIHIEK